ncbi:MAG: AI-2E family transporter [Anaerolineaceae bacterium]|nr:MAG: AI-2E family transporter [Anaerolineaceae bacterium]
MPQPASSDIPPVEHHEQDQSDRESTASFEFHDALQRSPRWPGGTKRLVVAALLVLAFLAIYRVRALLIPVIMSVVIAYVILPLVRFFERRTRLSRNLSIAVVYLGIAAILIAIPVGTIPQLITQGNRLLSNTPVYIEQLTSLLSEPLIVAGYTIPLNELPLEETVGTIGDDLVGLVSTVGPQGFSLFGNLASATVSALSTLGWLLLVLVFSYYIVRDHRLFWRSFVTLTPAAYHEDMQRLGKEISGIWNAFLRGQLILGIVVGFVTFLIALIVGLPNALFLGLIAGVLEFIPNIGPIIAAVPAVLLALFQYEESWLGSLVGPFWFALIVLALYGLVQRIENMYLVPRIIGRSLNLHPLVVLIGALAGASIAGVFGILLAAPLLASARLVLLYIYHKLLDQPPFGEA